MRINFPVLLSEMLRGAGVSLAIFFLTLIIALPLGLLVAAALGFTRWQTFKKIILPQTVKRVVPPMGNEFMTLVKDTSLARVIAVTELFEVAATAATSAVSVVPYVMAAVFYLVMNFVVGQAFLFAERRLNYYR